MPLPTYISQPSCLFRHSHFSIKLCISVGWSVCQCLSFYWSICMPVCLPVCWLFLSRFLVACALFNTPLCPSIGWLVSWSHFTIFMIFSFWHCSCPNSQCWLLLILFAMLSPFISENLGGRVSDLVCCHLDLAMECIPSTELFRKRFWLPHWRTDK